MEGVGARLGRSSTRYGPATVFTGPVRKWKKKWVHIAPSSSSSSTSTTTAAASNSNNNNGRHSHNGPSNGNNGSHLVLYKWTPITPSQNINNNNADTKQDNQDLPLPPDEPPRRKFKYIPVALLEEQKESENEINENIEDEVNPYGTADQSADGQIPKVVISNEKPDINDAPVDESQAQGENQVVRQDLNESTLDLSLGLTSHEDDPKSNSKSNQNQDANEQVNLTGY